MKKFLVLIITFMVIMGGLFASGVNESDTSKKQTVLRFLDVNPSPTRQTYYTSTFEKFETQTGIKVVYESVPWDDAANKLTVLGASNQLPDVLTMWAGWLGEFTEAEWIEPLDSYLGDSKSDFAKTVTDIVWKGENELYGHTYTVPDGMMVKGVFVRKDWAKAAGIELDPVKGWTYEEYFNVVHELTDKNLNHYGSSFRGARGAFDPLFVYLESFKGGYAYSEDGSTLFNDDVSVEAYKTWNAVYLDGCAPKDSINWGFVEMVDNFCGGLTATLINDSEVAVSCFNNMEPDQWMVMPMPKSDVDGKIYNTVNSPYSFAMAATSENKVEAWKLMAFLSEPENNIDYCKKTGLIPIKKDVGNDPYFGADGIYATFVNQLDNEDLVVPCGLGPFPLSDMHQGIMHEEMQKYLLGKVDAKTALTIVTEEMGSRMKTYLAENPGLEVEKPKTL
jgi:multiple sugar transport system substrate-binding protein